MKTAPEPDTSGKILLGFVLIVHLMFFVLEALLWMQPQVHTLLITLLNNPVSSDTQTQALTLKNLFVNQGFYNLFLAGSGIWGFSLVKKGQYAAGYALLLTLCFSAAGAGIVLALTTKAYVLAFFQCAPACVLLLKILPKYKNATTNVAADRYPIK
jgi:putative membrane protein